MNYDVLRYVVLIAGAIFLIVYGFLGVSGGNSIKFKSDIKRKKLKGDDVAP